MTSLLRVWGEALKGGLWADFKEVDLRKPAGASYPQPGMQGGGVVNGILGGSTSDSVSSSPQALQIDLLSGAEPN